MQNKTIQTTGWFLTTARSYTHHTQLQRWTHQSAGSKQTADQHSWSYSNLHVISLELSAILCQKTRPRTQWFSLFHWRSWQGMGYAAI